MTQSDHSTFLPFLLEIGSEEIPARFIPDSMAELERLSAEAFENAHLECGGLRVMATPRRLALLVEKMSSRQPDREVELKGPPVSVAFDDQGQPTPAGEGFARKAGVSLADCGRGSGAYPDTGRDLRKLRPTTAVCPPASGAAAQLWSSGSSPS